MLIATNEVEMAEIINLNRRRKAKARDEKSKQAEINRITFGRSKAEKEMARHESQQRDADLDGKKLED